MQNGHNILESNIKDQHFAHILQHLQWPVRGSETLSEFTLNDQDSHSIIIMLCLSSNIVL